ncbi:hypothetical protein [Tsuneonella sp. HG222]
MGHPLDGATTLTIGEGESAQEFILVLDHEALIAAEAAYRKPLALTMAEATLGFKGAEGAMLFGALRAHHPKVTLREANRMMLEHGDAIAPVLAEAAEAAFPKKEDGDEPRPRAKPRAGKSSGGNGAKRASTRKRSSGQRRKSSPSSLPPG